MEHGRHQHSITMLVCLLRKIGHRGRDLRGDEGRDQQASLGITPLHQRDKSARNAISQAYGKLKSGYHVPFPQQLIYFLPIIHIEA